MFRDTTDRIARIAQRIVVRQTRRPWLPVVVCMALAAIGAFFATRLELRTRFDQLLPDHQASAVELRRVEASIGLGQSVYVVLEGDDPKSLRDAGDALVPRLRALGAPWVTSAEDGPHAARDFLLPRAALFAATAELQQLQEEVDARWDWEIGKATGTNLDDVEPPPISADAIRTRFGMGKEERYPDGYYQSKDDHSLVVVARSSVRAGDLDGARQALQRVRDAVRAEAESLPFARVKVGYAGDLVTGLAEYGAVHDDLVNVGLLGLGLVLAVVAIYFMRVRALVAMALTMGVGLAWTFGLTQVAIGHLDVASGFLFSIIAGNGINFGIIYTARFYEELRAGKAVAQAVRIAHATTWPATLTAAVAAAAAYGSLGATDFLAFKHFAFIGAVGMLGCWIATYAVLPALLTLLERAQPFTAEREGTNPPTNRRRAFAIRTVRYEAPFVYLVERAPRTIAVVGIGLAMAGLTALVAYLRAGPMEYDMRRLQNDFGASSEMYRVSALAADVLGAEVESAMVILCDRVEQVEPLRRALEARRDASPVQEKPFESVHSLLDFVPSDQAAKIPLALELRDRLIRAHDRGFVGDHDWAEIERNLPPEDLTPWSMADLPDDLARPFTERDGTRGRLVLIEPTAGKSDSDLRYLLRWADSFRETSLPDGSIVRGSGRAVVLADILRAVETDMPRAVALSLGMTILAALCTFRRGESSVAVVAALLTGLAWVAFAMTYGHIKIHFFNFIALPVTFGIGVDYAVNIVQRYEAEGRGGILRVLARTGGAVILCSLTTTLGYLALLRSTNQAIRGLGTLAVVGEIACLLAAVLVLPAALLWRERRSPVHRAPESPLLDPAGSEVPS